MAARQAVDTLPTSTQVSMQDMVDGVSASDSPSAPTLQTPHLLPESNSVGQLSVMSDGSFIHVEGPASAEDAEGAECHDGVQALTPQEDSLSVELTGPAAMEDLAQEATTVDRLSEDMLEHAAETVREHTAATEESDEACSQYLSLVVAPTIAPHTVYICTGMWIPLLHVVCIWWNAGIPLHFIHVCVWWHVGHVFDLGAWRIVLTHQACCGIAGIFV